MFGTSLETGYALAVEETNAAGGIEGARGRRPVRLAILDNESDPNLASGQARDLVRQGACALLGAATTPLSIPVSVAAEQLEVPALSSITPIRAWQSGNDAGWQWAWNAFFDELQMTRTQFQASELVETNRRVALFTDLEEDGIVMGALWDQHAYELGYEVVYQAEFPVGIGDLSAQVAEAQATEADVVIAQVTPPDGVSLLHDLKVAGYCPKLLFIEKAGNTGGWARLTGGLCEGTCAAGWFAEGLGSSREGEFIERYREQLGGVDSNLGTIVFGYSIASVLIDAIRRVGAPDPAAINAEIAETDAEYPLGHVHFDAAHACPTPAIVTQWQGSDMVLVMLPDGSAGPHALRVPPSGLVPPSRARREAVPQYRTG
jgi:branched-chain amino acid transport system substrate-binding protein